MTHDHSTLIPHASAPPPARPDETATHVVARLIFPVVGALALLVGAALGVGALLRGSVFVYVGDAPGYFSGYSSSAYLLDVQTGIRRLLVEGASQVAVSPDGRWLVYNLNNTLLLRGLDGTGSDLSIRRAQLPAWSPDGTLIAYASLQAGVPSVYALNFPPDGKPPRLLVEGASAFAFAPDGTALAVVRPAQRFQQTLAVVALNGGSARDLVTVSGITAVTWGAGGILHTRFVDGNADLYLIQPDGSGERRLTDGFAFDDAPAWSPDGTRLAFTSDRSGGNALYWMTPDGANVVRLTDAVRYGAGTLVWLP